ncbi:hypothetical protein PFICI_12371 [Pestalotiopsis fici W106-1]|uniref:TLC domain-containing protein n=1 Tax=Pestalotiopsis fici (strain W106-1 / CGMCC3.15140) TaxID=1229662 RepID=W3WQK5_PESFW|nr:uncharacterized protein PFICI_12371 [Pestalotiopsis fici W106-1]ETS75427.1 hypothetical protein PFICI_12371 [Pestalotiopsis fici W106-1]
MADITEDFPTIVPRDEAKISGMKPGEIARDGTDLALILTVSLILYSLFAGLLQRGLLRRLYGEVYQALEETVPKGNERQRVSFIYHHIASICFAIIICIGAYPVISFTCGSGTLSTPMGNPNGATIGDVLSILLQVYCGYYLFEVTFRSKYISLIALAHHIGLLIIAQTAALLGSRASKSAEATKEFYLCMVWGAFDLVTELPLHIILIFWRIRRDESRLCYRIACACAVWVTVMALSETIVTAWLLSQSWAGWQLHWRIITPTLFTLWVCTQLYGAIIFLRMARQQRKICRSGL